MHKLDLPLDLKESATIERRKNAEFQRQSRVFNSKVRQIGIDLQSVQEQEKERRMMEEMERRRHEAFAADMKRQDKIGQLLAAREMADRRHINESENDFRRVHQQPDQQREWDLNDPEYLKKSVPARVCDDDPRCTISTLQQFEGEDLNSKARRKLQAEQLRNWGEQQMKEKNDAKARDDYSNYLYQLKAREMDERNCELTAAEDQCKKAILLANADYNKALAEEQRRKSELKKLQDTQDRQTSILNAVTSDMLTEDPAVATSSFGAHRVVTDRWKGMTPEQIAEIKRTQVEQIKENERLKSEEDKRNKEWDDIASANDKSGLLLQKQQERLATNLHKQMVDENLRLAAEQRAHQEFLNKEVYTNPPNAAYFMQFNTNSR